MYSTTLLRPKRLWCWSWVLFFVAGALLSGCGKDSPSGSEAVVLNQRLRAKIQTLDPADVGDTNTDGVCKEFFDTLYQYHYLKRPYEIIPLAAAQMPEISADGLTWRIAVRKDVYFHDDPCFAGGKGRNLKAADFLYAWKRVADIRTRSKNWYIFDGKIVGLDDFRQYTKSCPPEQVDYARRVDGLTAPDDHTIEIKLVRPWPQLIFWLAHVPTAPIAHEAVERYGPDIIKHPVGTGAFMLKQWHRGVYVEAVRNPNYYPAFYPTDGMPEDADAGLLADAGKRLPLIDRIIWRIMEEDQPRWLLLMKGDIDLNSIPKDNFAQAVGFGKELTPQMKRLGMRLTTVDEPCTFWVEMNMQDPLICSNKPLRYAIAHAIDRMRFIDLLWNGRGYPAYGFIPPAMKEYDESVKDGSHCVYDVNMACQYLKEAETLYGGKLPRFRLAMGGTDFIYKQMGQFLQRNLRDIGLDVQLEMFDWPTFLEKMTTGDLQLFFNGWMADYPDVESFLQIFYSKNAPWPNHGYYNNPQFDAIYEEVSIMPDCPERVDLYRQAEKIVIEDMPCAFTYHRIGYIIYHDWLNNLKPDGYKSDTIGYGYSKYYRIDSQKRDAYRKQLKHQDE
ncbi:MAG: ABC transporter substrate-binding protein [Planctomycetaceae bacterium]|nr:ABC transporter substrate-binding protein [Planctomycetaceae bacterium]